MRQARCFVRAIPFAPVSVTHRAHAPVQLCTLLHDAVVVRPGAELVGGLTAFDRHGVDGVVEGGSAAVGGLSNTMRRLQNGFVRSYALSLLGGALLVVLALLAVNLG